MTTARGSFKKFFFNSIVKRLASIKFAVFIILGFGVISAVGTFLEAQYDAEYAKLMVYDSIWMSGISFLLAICLIAVMVDRWPWQRRHTGFILAHIGILILMFGMWLSSHFGLDGSMSFGFGETNKYVTLPSREVLVHATSDGKQFTTLFQKDVEFIKNPPTADKPLNVPIEGKKLAIIGYRHYAIRSERVQASKDKMHGPSMRFLLQNQNVSTSKWLSLDGFKNTAEDNLGPAKVILTTDTKKPADGNQIVLRPRKDNRLDYEIYTARTPGKVRRGQVGSGESLQTGWMGLEFKVIQYFQHAERIVDFEPRERPTPLTTSAIQVQFGDEQRWLGMNEIYKFFSDSYGYYFFYGNKRLMLDMNLTLKNFEVGRYQGTIRAASYQSLVNVDGQKDVLISMNNPLKHKGLTFYQASFQEDEQGQPTASVLSVNQDPGRPFKYLGSLLICLGSAILFWFKRAKIFKGASS